MRIEIKVVISCLLFVLFSIYIFNLLLGDKKFFFEFTDISRKQVFECQSKSMWTYKAAINLKGEISDSIEFSIHEDIEKSATPKFKYSKLSGALDTTFIFSWGPVHKLVGVIDPSARATGHLKVSCRLMKDF